MNTANTIARSVRQFSALFCIGFMAAHGVRAGEHIRASAETDFFPTQPPGALSVINRYATFPETMAGPEVSAYPGMIKLFYWDTSRVMKPEAIPGPAFVREHLKLVPADRSRKRPMPEDVAYLRYKIGDMHILVARTGTVMGRTHLFFKGITPSRQLAPAEAKAIAKQLLDVYFKVEVFGNFVLEARPMDSVALVSVVNTMYPNSKAMVAAFAKGRAYFMVGLLDPDAPMPSSGCPPDQWFKLGKNAFADIDVDTIRTQSREQIRALIRRKHDASQTRRNDELEQILKRGQIGELERLVRTGPFAHAQTAVEALAQTPEGRIVLAQMMREPKFRHGTRVVAALSKAGTPDAIAILKEVANAGKNPNTAEEAMEAVLKRMPDAEVHAYCLSELEKLADAPDAQPGKVIFLMRGLPENEDPRHARALRFILRNTRNDRVRRASIDNLAEWYTDPAERRDASLRLLKTHLEDKDIRTRVTAIRALGASNNIRELPVLAPLLDSPDRRIRSASARSMCELVGWESIPRDAAGVAQLKTRLEPILEALKKLEDAIGQE